MWKSKVEQNQDSLTISPSFSRILQFQFPSFLLLIISFFLFIIGIDKITGEASRNDLLGVSLPFIIGSVFLILAFKFILGPLRSKMTISETGVTWTHIMTSRIIKWSEISTITIIYCYWLLEGKNHTWLKEFRIRLKNQTIIKLDLIYYSKSQRIYIKNTFKSFIRRFSDINLTVDYEKRAKFSFN
ncbi:hypothetical protein [Candidatus Hodarchaeum mangrovi]